MKAGKCLVVLGAVLLTGLLTLLGMPRSKAEPGEKPDRVVLLVHGGAGDRAGKSDPRVEKALRDGLTQSLKAGYEVLKKEKGTSLDAVEAAIRVLEDDPHFNAGRGAVFTHEGKNELDAAIMDGKDKRAGAVASVTIIKNPITAARRVMDTNRHVLLIGRGAELFATREGLEIVDPSYFWTLPRWKDLQRELKKEKSSGKHSRRDEPGRRHLGTVGAVALDRQGNLAAGTSTGGLTNKWTGRVGDTPIIGAGTYADNDSCAVSCTGVGEFFIRYTVAHEIAALVKYKGMSVQKAADEVINGKLKGVGGEGAVIVLDRHGNGTAVFNGEQMSRGWITESGKDQVFILEQQDKSK
jgi:beta-aspartyl-peptidase (threonine type)